MADYRTEFECIVPEHGYGWVKRHGSGRHKWLSPEQADFRPDDVGGADYHIAERMEESDSGSPGTQRSVLKRTAFLEFASMEPTADEILRFANTYGLLMADTDMSAEWFRLPHPKLKRRHVTVRAESIVLWTEFVAMMRDLIALGHAIRTQSKDTLKHYIHWREKDEVYFVLYGDLEDSPLLPIASSEYHPERLLYMKPDDVIEPARYYFQDALNRHIRENLHSQLVWEPEPNNWVVHVSLKSLIGAMWFQMVNAIAGDTERTQGVRPRNRRRP